MTHPNPETLRARCTSLFRFLRDVTTLRSTCHRSVDEYDRVLWLADVPDEPECDSIATRSPTTDDAEEPDELWLAIDKPALRPPPEPPAALDPWLGEGSLDDPHLDQPVLRERIRVVDGDVVTELELDREPQVQTSFRYYLRERWLPWALEHRRLHRVQRIYSELFAMQQRLERRSEDHQVGFGLGLLSWNRDGKRIRRHLVVADASIEVDATTGRIRVGPGVDGAEPSLEQDMLDPADRPSPQAVTELERSVRELGDAVWQPDAIADVCARWVHSIAADGRFSPSIAAPTRVSDAPTVTFAPAIVLRQRSERSLLRAFDEVLRQLDTASSIPFGLARFVDVVDEEPAEPPEPNRPERVLMPLPSNTEQRRVLDRLDRQQGVLVQGPPGTGKSHTIANLICHLLATGQRVLVTSHTARALEVLRDKLPGDFADLCVMLLGTGRDSLQSLEQSVQAITEHQQRFDPATSAATIDRLESALADSERAAAQAAQELREHEERDTFEHAIEFDGVHYRGTALQIAAELDATRLDFGWIPDAIEPDCELPLGDDEIERLAAIEPDIVPMAADGDRFVPIEHDRVATWFETERTYDGTVAPAHLEATAPEWREALARHLSTFTSLRAELTSDGSRPWIARAVDAILAGQDVLWRELAEMTDRTVANAAGDPPQLVGLGVRAPDEVALDATALRDHLAAGGGFGLWIFRPRVVRRTRYLWESVTVDGRLAKSGDALDRLLDELRLAREFDALDDAWRNYAEPPNGPRQIRRAWYTDAAETLGCALRLEAEARAIRAMIDEYESIVAPDLRDAEAVRTFAEGVIAARDASRLSAARDAIGAEIARASATGHAALERLADALTQRSADDYADALARLAELDELHALLDRLATAGAPELALRLQRDDRPDVEGLRRAWAFGRCASFLREGLDSDRETDLRASLRRCRDEQVEHTTALAEARAWHELLSNLDETKRQHLVAWTKAVRRIGKGTGKHAPRHRRAAREHMEHCRSAIPGWIMPMYRVAETIRAGVDVFDVVIIDEASQSGPEALLLLYLTKKVVVVGDDKQISPDYVGLTRDDVEHLRRRHLADLPHSDAFSLEHSLFDLADIRYGNRVRLREHFRCMPEIIRFSNDLCYRSEPLIPLKQFGAGRLTPVIVTEYVRGGVRAGTETKVFNPPEAEAIVERIAACHADPAYAGKTFGVISLQGGHQAQWIEGKLLESLGPDVILERDLVCGDAYAFQGDERDVMFLSLVAARSDERRIGTLADQRSERRFNVAFSRAREQVFLFHSVTVDDLSPKCLRRTLLEYCLDPAAGLAASTFADHGSLAAADRREPVPPPFDSWFEVDVCTEIARRGYRVEPQVEVAGFRLDLVVVGDERKLAVECDGDAWHGAEAFDRDQARQRKLERCGWTFFRVRGSAFYLDRKAALEPLWGALARHRIDPLAPSRGIADAAPERNTV